MVLLAHGWNLMVGFLWLDSYGWAFMIGLYIINTYN